MVGWFTTRSLKLRNFPKWDYVILTASNEQQAEGFRKQIEERRDFLPKETTFVAIPDRDGKRVGSGGATLEVLKYLHEQEESFDGLRILVIHSGGDSKRVPQYSSLGKLFSPVPHVLPNGRNSTLFDEFMICMSSVPSRIREGMVLLSGDVLLLFQSASDRLQQCGRSSDLLQGTCRNGQKPRSLPEWREWKCKVLSAEEICRSSA